jgi:hypothetical protein
VGIEGCAAVIADLSDVIPHIACSEAHISLIECKLVWALRLNQEFGEVIQTDPLGLVTAACVYQAGYIVGNHAVLAVPSISDKQVSFAVAVLALDKNLIFDHHRLLSGV